MESSNETVKQEVYVRSAEFLITEARTFRAQGLYRSFTITNLGTSIMFIGALRAPFPSGAVIEFGETQDSLPRNDEIRIDFDGAGTDIVYILADVVTLNR